MLRLLTILFFTLCALPQIGRAQSVTLFQGSVLEALESAKREDKYVLLEFLAPWSRKSNWMHSVILKSTVVAESFIVYSIDTNDELGASMAQQYSVTDYPFLVIFDSNGSPLLKLDKTYSVEDFNAKLLEVQLSQSGDLLWELETIYRIATSATSLKSSDAKRLQQLVSEYLQRQRVEHLLAQSHWDIFSSDVITYYTADSFKFLRDNISEFFDSDIARERFEDIVYEILIGAIVEPQTAHLEPLDTLYNDSVTLSMVPYSSGLIELYELYKAEDAVGYIYKLERVVGNIDEKYEYQLIMSLNWAIPYLDKRDSISRKRARQMVESLLLLTDSPTKISLIESLLCEI